jgi:hypothetical protein
MYIYIYIVDYNKIEKKYECPKAKRERRKQRQRKFNTTAVNHHQLPPHVESPMALPLVNNHQRVRHIAKQPSQTSVADNQMPVVALGVSLVAVVGIFVVVLLVIMHFRKLMKNKKEKQTMFLMEEDKKEDEVGDNCDLQIV